MSQSNTIPNMAVGLCSILQLKKKKKSSKKGRKKEESEFVDFTAWGKTAEYLAQYSKKGDKIPISCELVQEGW